MASIHLKFYLKGSSNSTEISHDID